MKTPTASASSGGTDATTLYLVRHGATAANLADPPRIQGRRSDPPLAEQGLLQARTAGQFLADRPVVACYTSPLLRAVQTARIVAEHHGITPVQMVALSECDAGDWEGLDWPSVRLLDPEGYRRFHDDPARSGYPGGESYADVHRRAAPVIDQLLAGHAGKSIVVVAHHVVNRTYLAGLLGLRPGQAREVVLDNGAVSVVVRRGGQASVIALDAAAQLRGL